MTKQTKLLMFAGLCSAALICSTVLGNQAQAQKTKKSLEGTKMAQANSNWVKTPSGLQYQDVKVGTGPSPRQGQTVVVHYTGWLTNGNKFDSSHDRNQPFEFHLGMGEVIKGWDEGVGSMKVGGKRKLTIPPNLGYGDRGAGGVIPPGATLVFEVDLLGLK